MNQNINFPEPKTPAQLTSKLGKDTIIGRAKELEKINTLLKEANSLLLINGIGGIGKSTIASYYLHSQKENLDYYGFFEGLENFISELRTNLALQQEKDEDVFMEALSKLRNLKGNKLLVFDDVKEIEKNQDKIEKILALKDSGYKILLTSREEIEDVEQYYLDVLSLDDAKELFNSIYKVEDEILLEEVLGYLDCHAFFVEMTAKTLENKKTLTPEIIKNKFDSGEFSTIKRKRKESFNDYLNELFSFDELDNDEILMLKQLSVLPSIEIEFEFLQEIFGIEDNEEFEEVLNYLCEKGWLNYSNKSYKLHQIVKEYIFDNHKPVFDEIKVQINYFILMIEDSKNPRTALKIHEYLLYFSFIHKIIQRFKIKNLEVAKFYMSLGNIYNTLGNYKTSMLFIKLSQQLYESILGKNHILTSTLNHNLGQLYYMMGEDDKALPLLLEDLEVAKQEYDKNHIDFAGNYANIGNIYLRQGKISSAINLLQSALSISLLNLGEKALETAIHYNNLGNVYRHIPKYKESLKNYKKSIDIIIDVEGEEHPHLIGGYNNIGEVHSQLKEYKQALYFLKKGLELSTKIFNDNTHPNIGYVYGNIGLVYDGMKKYKKAYSYTKIAIEIFENNFFENHPYLISAKQELKRIDKKLDRNKSVSISAKVERNKPCICGSGKKYKKCCGKNS